MRRERPQFGNKHVVAEPSESIVIAFFAGHSTPLRTIPIIPTRDKKVAELKAPSP
jgi:hypothetical protein